MNLAKNILIKAIYFRVSIQQQRGDHKKSKKRKKANKKDCEQSLKGVFKT
jgi:hypothetical protein